MCSLLHKDFSLQTLFFIRILLRQPKSQASHSWQQSLMVFLDLDSKKSLLAMLCLSGMSLVHTCCGSCFGDESKCLSETGNGYTSLGHCFLLCSIV